MREPYQIAFVMEQTLGHVTHTKNLETNVSQDPSVNAHWLKVPFEREGLARWVPGYGNWTIRAGLRAKAQVRDLIKRQPVDVLFFHTQVQAVFSVDRMRHTPTVISLDATPINYDSLGQYYDHEPGPDWLERLKFRLNRRAFCHASHLVTWVAWAKRSLVDDYGIDPAKIDVIPPGVNPGYWRRPAPRQPLPQASGLPKIIFVGGNLPRKGGDMLLRVFRERFRGRAALYLVTRTPIAPEPGVFVYDDIVPNDPRLVQLYHEADLFCLPTYGDCLPMVLSEAMAASLPVISTSVAGIPELVAHGESGLLIAPGDERGLAESLETLLNDPVRRIQMGARGQAIVEAGFDAAKNAQRLLDLLKRLAETGFR